MNDIRFVVSPRIMGEEKFFGPGIAVLLHRVEEWGSPSSTPPPAARRGAARP